MDIPLPVGFFLDHYSFSYTTLYMFVFILDDNIIVFSSEEGIREVAEMHQV